MQTNAKMDTLGVSVYHLEHIFLNQLVCNSPLRGQKPNSRMAKIHEIEDLSGSPGVVRQYSAETICPIDGRKGSAYVHVLSGEDHVGEATHMLSYTWG